MKQYTVPVQYDAETDDYYLQFTDDMLTQVGWQIGDTLTWTRLDDHSWQLTRTASVNSQTPLT
jgi:hypothetical protein